MLVLGDASFYALMAVEFQEIPTIRPDSCLAHMRERTLFAMTFVGFLRAELFTCGSADTDSAVRCEHS